jgi:tetratricopeptide (TPR) repeat protein
MVHQQARRATFGPLTLGVLTIGLSLGGRPAQATTDDPTAREKARAIVLEGAKLYERGDFSAALAHFQSAYAVFASPKIHYNLGLAFGGMGRHAQALGAFERFLREASDAAAEQLEDARAQVKRLSGKVAFVTIAGGPEGAEIVLDGVRIGAAPLTGRVPIDPGQHALVVRGTGFGSWTKSFSATAGQLLDFKVDVQGGSAAGQQVGRAAGSPDAVAALPILQAEPPVGGGPSNSAAASEQLVLKGVELRKQRKHLEAYDYFRRAFDISPTARPAAQLGLVEYQLGRWVDSEIHLEQALRAAGDPWIRKNRETIQQALDTVRSHIAYIEIKGTPAGADVSVNGRKVGKLPLEGLVKAGDGYAEVLVGAAGYAPVRQSLNLQAQLTQQFFVTLEPQTPAISGGRLSSAGGRGAAESSLSSPRPPEGQANDLSSGSASLRVAALVAAAVGVAAIGYGALQTYRVLKLTEEVRRTDNQGIARGRAAERNQWLGYGAGGGALAIGAVLYWLAQPDQAEPVALSVTAHRDVFFVSLRM